MKASTKQLIFRARNYANFIGSADETSATRFDLRMSGQSHFFLNTPHEPSSRAVEISNIPTRIFTI
ncbi:MAG: hypothetical protein ACK5B6_12520 [Bacteroidia bacterium]